MNPVDVLQLALDTFLYPKGIHVYYQSKVNPDDPQEYVVYKRNGEYPVQSGDNKVLLDDTRLTIQYFYQTMLLNTPGGRTRIYDIPEGIQRAIRPKGFYTPNGPFDAGDIEGTGYNVTILEVYYARWR